MKELKRRIMIATIGLTVGLAGIGCGLMAYQSDHSISRNSEKELSHETEQITRDITDLMTIRKT